MDKVAQKEIKSFAEKPATQHQARKK